MERWAMAKALGPWPTDAALLSSRRALSPRRSCAPACLQASRAVMEADQKMAEEFRTTERPLGISRTYTLTPALDLEEAMATLTSYISELNSPPFQSGILRFQVPLPNSVNLLQWLQCQPESHHLLPQVYFSGRYPPQSSSESCSQVAGLGSAVLFRGIQPFNEQHWKSINRFLSDASPFLKAYGAIRFDPDVKASAEWEAFGTYYFFVPRVELYETSSNTFLAANLAWGDIPYEAAVEVLLLALEQVSLEVSPTPGRLHSTKISKEHTPDQVAWHSSVDSILSALRDASDLTKVVMARRTDVQVDGEVRPYCLLALLQEQNPSAYQFCIRLPDGSAFLGNTPEQLFARNGVSVTSEAVAATRPRGATSKDEQQIVLDLFQSAKDNSEFQIVEDTVRNCLESVCQDVQVLMQKGLVKQPKVQHLCTRFSGEIVGMTSEIKLLTTLHPTPAVCGHPYASAQALIRSIEPFDRGMYAGPVGWFGGQGAEFAVGIRSCLIHSADEAPAKISLYAGVGVVEGSKAASEWDELELKISQFEQLLQPSRDLEDSVNINMLWSDLIVEECCRLGVTYFCIAPGSRSSPLAEAASANPRVSCVSCLDERSLAYFALGFGRGCRRPAAVVVTSGTAVSNLLPAVVEASQDCVPLLILSADRPHELRDTGSNQTINQVQHFGGYTRYHFDLPAATDEVPARMLLTTLDAAVYRATSVPYGPVHINCPFREPLEGVFQSWDHRCLAGLSQWVRSSSPFTTYVPSRLCPSEHASNSQMKAVASLISNAKTGLLVIGGLKQEESGWAVLKLAKHLNWPLVPDILSGVKLAANGEDTNIMCNFDQILLRESLHSSLAPDVILQIGSRITSKRLGHFLNKCSPNAFILVDEHPYRHDSGHKLTHRINCNVTEFTKVLLKIKPEPQDESYLCWLRLLNDTVRRESSFHLLSEDTVTEPWIARVFSSSVSYGSAIFLGNSMPIRDVDMYGERFFPTDDFAVTIRCDANRGASGIDGVLSTAVGFAAGTKKRVTLLLGDVSFLHDTNGLTLLGREGLPVTVVLVNNHGGAIFSLLPVVNYMAEVPFKTLLSTCHQVQIRQVCAAHGVNHVSVESKDQLIEALESVRSSQSSSVVEIDSNIQRNADFHRHLQQEMDSHLTFVLSKLSSRSRGSIEITEVDILRYRFPLEAPVTTNIHRREREGYILRITLASGHFGLGEIAPLEGLHEESLKDAEVQLRFLQRRLRAARVDETVVLLDGSISEWIWKRLKIQPDSIFPSVRCGLEMAVLEALASWKGCTLFALLNGAARPTSEAINVCGLIDSQDKPDEVAEIAAKLVREKCFTTLKFKVARRASALEDAEVLAAVRRKLGPDVKLRADANRRWTLEQALDFSEAVQDCELEYLEEPLQDISELKTFLEQVQMPVAIDESLDLNAADFSKFLQRNHSRHMVAAIIKPSKVGGFEKARMLSRLSHKRKMNAVISASFESSIALAAYAQFAAACIGSSVAHGLGTFTWLKGDVVDDGFGEVVRRGTVAPSEAGQISRKLRMDLMERLTSPRRRTFTIVAHQCKLRVVETISVESAEATLVFLHGLLGRAEEWIAVMESLGNSYRCLSIELPGHGQSQGPKGQSIESLGDALSEALKQLSVKKVVLVGYSLGARLALYMSVHAAEQLEAVVSISGSPGLRSENARRERALQDEELANSLRVAGLSYFVSMWYEKPLWKSLRCHPDFKAIQEARLLHDDISGLADTIQSLSVGRQRSLWDELAEPKIPTLVVTGSLDKKFVNIGHEMSKGNHRMKHVQLPGSGHAVHVECPLLFIRTLTGWLESINAARVH